MLVLIVVAASIALAAFVASYQKQLQAQQAESHARSLESLKVLDIAKVTPKLSPSQLTIASFSFILASESINPSTVSSFSVNGNPLAFYLVQNVSPSGGVPFCYNDSTLLTLQPFAEVQVSVNTSNVPLTPGTCPFAFFDPTTTVAVNSFLKVSMFTTLQNTFVEVFLPPTAVPLIGTVTQFTGSAFRNVPLLDASQSFQSGNGTIVSYAWHIVNTTLGPPPSYDASGAKVVAPFVSTGFGHTYVYNITLTLQNSNGLLGIANFLYSYSV